MSDELIQLYKQMSDMTFPECRDVCRVPLSCCSPEYCEATIEHAKERWGTTLEPTGHPRLPLMGPTGCIADPHLRPMCTLHTCAINGAGFKVDDMDWTTRYFELRGRISDLEAQEHGLEMADGYAELEIEDDYAEA